MPDGILHQRLNSQRNYLEIALLYIVDHLEPVAEPHLFDVHIGIDIGKLLLKWNKIAVGHSLDTGSQVCREVVNQVRGILRVVQDDLTD